MDNNLNTQALIVAKVRQSLLSVEDLCRCNRIVVGLSGGPDSVAMLLVLRSLQAELALDIVVCHVNHRLRGDESDGDEQFCRELCDRLELPFQAYRTTDSDSAEAQLRDTRYGFLLKCAQAHETALVATAHTLDDQVETVLFRLFRGTAPSGARGMGCVKQMKNGLILLRPFLNVSRKEVTELLRLSQVEARQDSSNLGLSYSRNFIRHKILPICEERFPSLRLQLERYRKTVQADETYLARQCVVFAEELGGFAAREWSIDALLAGPESLQRRFIVRCLEEREIEVSFERVEAILNMVTNRSPSRLSLSESWEAITVKDSLHLFCKPANSFNSSTDLHVILKVPGETDVPALGKTISILEWKNGAPKRFPARQAFEAYVDLSAINYPLEVRSRLAGDKIQPLGMQQLVSLKKFIHTHKTDADCWTEFVICNDEEVLWLPGVGLSEKLKVRQELPTHSIRVWDALS